MCMYLYLFLWEENATSAPRVMWCSVNTIPTHNIIVRSNSVQSFYPHETLVDSCCYVNEWRPTMNLKRDMHREDPQEPENCPRRYNCPTNQTTILNYLWLISLLSNMQPVVNSELPTYSRDILRGTVSSLFLFSWSTLMLLQILTPDSLALLPHSIILLFLHFLKSISSNQSMSH